MKKLFVSCPMKNRKKENIELSIKTLHKLAESMFNKKLNLIQTYIDDEPPKNVNAGLWYLSKSIEKLADADYFIGCSNRNYVGCEIELKAAIAYNVPTKIINCKDFKCFDDLK